MKLTYFKPVLTLALSISGMCLIPSAAYADGYVRPGIDGDSSYWNEGASLPAAFEGFNRDYFNNALFVYRSGNQNYVRLPGGSTIHRLQVLKLQRSIDGQQDGPREFIALPSKADANAFCKDLIRAVHGIASDQEPRVEETVFVSDWLGNSKQVISVGYKVDYKDEDGDKLTPAVKYALCPNPWNWVPSKLVPEENEDVGIKASGFVTSNDIRYYKVECMNSNRNPATAFWFFKGVWTNGKLNYSNYPFSADPTPNVETLNTNVGEPYCKRNGT